MLHIEEIKNKTEELFLSAKNLGTNLKNPEEISIELIAFTKKIEQIPNSIYLNEYLEKWIHEDKARLEDLDNLQIDKKVMWYYERMIYVLELKLNTLKISGLILQN